MARKVVVLGVAVTKFARETSKGVDEMAQEAALMALKDAGYEFVTLKSALKDKIYSMPEAYYSLKGLGYPDMIDQSDPDLIPAE